MKYKIIVDKQNRTNPSNMKKEYVIDIEELRYKGNVSDSITITPTEAYVTRRLSLNEYQVLSVLKKSKKEPLGDLNIELFEGENYIYLFDMEGNKFYAEYLLKSDVTDMYVTTKEMTSTINQTAQSIELSVNYRFMDYSTTEEMNTAINMKANEITSTVSETYSTKNETATAKQEAIDSANTSTDNKLDNYSTTVEMNSAITQKANEINLELEGKVDEEKFTGANIMLAINNDSSSATINADKISLNGKKINLTSEDIVIESDNFSVDKNGSIKAKSGTIGGFDITENYMSCSKEDSYGYIGNMSKGNFLFIRTGTEGNYDFPFYVREDGSVYATKMNITGGKINLTDSGTSETSALNIKSSNSEVNWESSYMSHGAIFNGEGLVSIDTGAGFTGGSIYVSDGIEGTSNYTIIQNGAVDAVTIQQRSLESAKKNFEKLKSGLDIIKNIDIYKYNLKSEDDNTKKHIGFVIGDNYNYSEEITSNNNDGVDIYSFVAVCCKAIQEQQEQIENQNNLIKSLTERIEKLEVK